MKTTTFLGLITAVTLLMFGIAYLLFAKKYTDDTFQFINAGIAVSYITTVCAFLLSQSALMASVIKFMTHLFGSMFAKMIVGIAVIVVVIIFFGEYKKPYIFSYFVAYFLHTGLEVFVLMRNLQQASAKTEPTKE